MNAIFKDFVDDIKDGFNALPEYLGIVLFLCLLFGIVLGTESAIDTFVILFGFWLVLYVLFPLFILILDIINYIFGLEDKNKQKE